MGKSRKHMARIKSLLNSYLIGTLGIFAHITDYFMIMIKRLHPLILLALYSEKSKTKIFRKLVEIFHYKEKHPIVSTFPIIKEVYKESTTQEFYIRGLIYTYSELSCDYKKSSILHQEFLSSMVVDVVSSDIDSSVGLMMQYFAHISQTIEKTLNSRNDIFKLYTWHFLSQFELWSRIVTTVDLLHNHSDILHSIVQLMIGVAHLCGPMHNIFFRFRVAKFLDRIAQVCHKYIPVVSLLLECFRYNILRKSSQRFITNHSGKIFSSQIINQTTKEILKHFSLYACHPAIFEHSYYITIRLLSFAKKMRTLAYKHFIKHFVLVLGHKIEILRISNNSIACTCVHKMFT